MVGWMEYESNDQKGAVFIFVLTIFLFVYILKGGSEELAKKTLLYT